MPTGFPARDAPSIFRPLLDLLARVDGDAVVLTFNEIAALIGRRYLPEAAVVHRSWWTAKGRAHVRAWTALGWHARAEGNEHRVHFTREEREG